MQHLSALLPMIKPNLINLMVEWLDFFNRRKPGAVIVKENMLYGIYDSNLNQCIYDVLRLQTELFSPLDIMQMLNRYSSMNNPLLSSLYMTRILKCINKQHREGRIVDRELGVDLMFNQQIATEYKKEGKWLILALLYNPNNSACWSYFLQWLLFNSFYEEDASLSQLLSSTAFNEIFHVMRYDRNVSTGITISFDRNDVVYVNVLQLFVYLKEYKQAVLEAILDNPQHEVYKAYYQEDITETSEGLIV